MLSRIGKAAAPVDSVDLLLECHVRIRSFLEMAQRIAQTPDAGDAAVADAAARVHRYFTKALPLHAQDEEQSILPRLRGRDRELDAALAAMAREHGEHEPPLRRLVDACAELARAPGRRAELAGAIAAATIELQEHFVTHLAREESVIFPAMRRLLDAASDAAIVREIRARRGVGEDRPGGAAAPAR